jgi:hypothetical protein
MKRWMLAMFAVFSLAAASAARSGEPLDALIERTLTAYGGAALPAPGAMFRVSGRNWSNSRGAEGALLRALRWPDYLRVEISYEDGGRETRLLVGDEGWRDGAPASSPLVAAMKLQAARLALPMLLDLEADRGRDIGVARRDDGIDVRRLRVELGGGLSLFVEIDAGSARILRSAGVMTMGGMEMSFGAAYGDFRKLGVLSWPGREDQSAMGQETGWSIIEAIEVNPPLERDALHP